VLGAPVPDLMLMLNREFAGLIVLAFLIGTPLGYLLVEQWLRDFVVRTSIDWLDCLLPGLLAFLIALVTVSYLSLKAARQNPVKVLRYE
jgi:putative ABC transport system permease protein